LNGARDHDQIVTGPSAGLHEANGKADGMSGSSRGVLMRRLLDSRFHAAVVVLVSSLASPMFAQAPAPAPTQPETAAPSRLSPEQRQRLRAARDACIAEVKPSTLPRGERRRAMRACLEAKNPELAPIFSRGEARRAEIRALQQSCREEQRGKRLGRDERRQAIRTCMVGKKPELQKVFTCRDEAQRKNLAPGMERRDFMRTCLRA
jgi:hypothetical protein